MLGFIKKDFLVMKSSLKAMAVMLAAYIIFTIIGIFDFTLMVPLLGMIVLISTFPMMNKAVLMLMLLLYHQEEKILSDQNIYHPF